MAGRPRQRQAANPADQATLTINEKILKECHLLYTDPDNGLVRQAGRLGLTLLAPRKKIVVLLIGNHSAGKSSFINWYIEEPVQKTGVAIETQGFVFVTSGKKRESLTGKATLHLYPHFAPLQDIQGVVEYLSTEISTSKQKKFSLVTLVDTPGLVDGDMHYPFDVNKAILWLGNVADLIFVFFDPIGQALCKRTMSLVEKLAAKHAERMRFFLSKADEAGHESDRQRVMMQIVQELCKRPGLNRTGFDMPTIYIPNPNKPSRCVNQIEDVCKDIERTINQTIQNTLNTLETDCEQIACLIDEKIAEDNRASKNNVRAYVKGFSFAALGALLPLLIFLNFVASSVSHELLFSVLGRSYTETMFAYLTPVRRFWSAVPSEHHWAALFLIAALSASLIFLAEWMAGLQPTLSRKNKRRMLEAREHFTSTVKARKQALYREYLQQSVADHDL